MRETPDIWEHANKNLAAMDAGFVRGGGRTTLNTTTLLTDFVGKEDQLKPYVTVVTLTSSQVKYKYLGGSVSDAGNWVEDSVNLSNYYTRQETIDNFAAKFHTHAISDITNLQSTLNAKANTAGTTFTGDVQLNFTPANATSAANIGYVDNAIAGLKFKMDVVAASTATVDINNPPSTLDDVALSNGSRILLKNQTTAQQNGIYVYNGAGVPLSRPADADTGTELANKTIPVNSGTINADTWWTVTNDTITIGTTAIQLTQTGGSGSYTNGTGISLNGNAFSLDLSYTDARYVTTSTAQNITSAKTFSGNNNGLYFINNATIALTNSFGAGTTVGAGYFQVKGDSPNTNKYLNVRYNTLQYSNSTTGFTTFLNFTDPTASRTILIPDKDGTLAMITDLPQSSVSGGYQPWENQRLNSTSSPTFVNLTLTGLATAANMMLVNTTTAPPATAGYLTVWSNNGSLAWTNTFSGNSYWRRFISSTLTANRTYTFLDKDYTLADDADSVHRLNSINESITGVKTFLSNPVINAIAPALNFTSSSDNLSATISRDSTGNTFKVINPSSAGGNSGKALLFDAPGTKYGTFNDAGLPSGANPAMSVSIWFKVSTPNASGYIWAYGDYRAAYGDNGTRNARICLRVNDNTSTVLEFSRQGAVSSNVVVNSSKQINDGNWHHAVVTCDGTTWRLYVDNVQANASTSVSNIVLNGATGIIAGQYSVNGVPLLTTGLNGSIDQFLIYNRALSTPEVATLWNSGIGVFSPSTASIPGKIVDVEFDEGSGTTATDNTGTKNITLINNPTWDLNGKISSGAGSSTTNFNVISASNGLVGGDGSIITVGDFSNQLRLSGQFINVFVNNYSPLTIGKDGNIRVDAMYTDNRTAAGSVSPYSRLLIGTATTDIAQLRFSDSVSSPVFSTNTTGGLYRYGSNLYWNNGTSWQQLNNQAGGGGSYITSNSDQVAITGNKTIDSGNWTAATSTFTVSSLIGTTLTGKSGLYLGNSFTTLLQSTATQNRSINFQDKSGTVAMVEDGYYKQNSSATFNTLSVIANLADGGIPAYVRTIGGTFFGWNLTNGGGESDFINSQFDPAGTVGGFRWYNLTTNNTLSLLMDLNGTTKALTTYGKFVLGALDHASGTDGVLVVSGGGTEVRYRTPVEIMADGGVYKRTARDISFGITTDYFLLSTDYYYGGSVFFTSSLPPCSVFDADGEKMFTILNNGQATMRMYVPLNYALDSPAGQAVQTGSGYADIPPKTKVQVIPIGTNSFYLQPLNGYITIGS